LKGIFLSGKRIIGSLSLSFSQIQKNKNFFSCAVRCGGEQHIQSMADKGLNGRSGKKEKKWPAEPFFIAITTLW